MKKENIKNSKVTKAAILATVAVVGGSSLVGNVGSVYAQEEVAVVEEDTTVETESVVEETSEEQEVAVLSEVEEVETQDIVSVEEDTDSEEVVTATEEETTSQARTLASQSTRSENSTKMHFSEYFPDKGLQWLFLNNFARSKLGLSSFAIASSYKSSLLEGDAVTKNVTFTNSYDITVSGDANGYYIYCGDATGMQELLDTFYAWIATYSTLTLGNYPDVKDLTGIENFSNYTSILLEIWKKDTKKGKYSTKLS